jgi:16S rRNA processing protein RimM
MVEKILVGVIIGPHGIRGEVKVKSFTDDPKAIATYRPLVSAAGEKFEIVKIKAATDHFICTLKTVTDRNASEKLKGVELFITRAQLPAGEIYFHDLIGKPVFNGNQQLGIVVGFENFGAGDVMDVKIEGRADTVLIPYNAVFILEASKDKVSVDLPDDYLIDEKQP